MCVYGISETEILKKDTYFYKLVRGSKQNKFFTSLTLAEYRSIQYLNPDKPDMLHDNVGKTFSYKIGEEITSDFGTTPGMYCYVSKEEAKIRKGYWPESYSTNIRVLKVLVKKGTRIRYASNSARPNYKNVVLVEALTPVELVQMD